MVSFFKTSFKINKRHAWTIKEKLFLIAALVQSVFLIAQFGQKQTDLGIESLNKERVVQPGAPIKFPDAPTNNIPEANFSDKAWDEVKPPKKPKYRINGGIYKTEHHKKVALIVTEIRSGSSFLGEIFNFHPDVFYLYEPLILSPRHYLNASDSACINILSTKSDPEPYPDSRKHYDQEIFQSFYQNCILPSPKKYLIDEAKLLNDSIITKAQNHRKHITSQCLSSELCFPGRHHFYHNMVSHVPLPIYARQAHWTNICKKKKVLAGKVVRVCEFEELEELSDKLSADKIDLEVFLLVRDPRAVYSSKMNLYDKTVDKIGKKERLEMKINENECLRMNNFIKYIENRDKMLLYDIEHAESHASSKLLKKINVIQYEKMATDPYFWTSQIYEILGLEMTDFIKSKIKDLTQGHQGGNDGRMGTNKNSTEVVEKWKKQLFWKEVDELQVFCKTTLKYFDYTIYDEKSWEKQRADKYEESR